MNRNAHRNQLICAYSGFAFVLLFLVGFWPIAGFVPPPSPGNSAEVTAAFFAEHTLRIRIGMWVTMVGCALVASWTVAVSAQLRRIDGAETLAQLQLILGALLTIEFLIPVMIWQAAAYRPDGDPEITARYNDLAWLVFLGPACPLPGRPGRRPAAGQPLRAAASFSPSRVRVARSAAIPGCQGSPSRSLVLSR
jgi:hypothetical protein